MGFSTILLAIILSESLKSVVVDVAVDVEESCENENKILLMPEISRVCFDSHE